MLQTLAMRVHELSEDDVLRIDPVVEYDYRQHLRIAAERWLARTNDDSNEIVEAGRPTGP